MNKSHLVLRRLKVALCGGILAVAFTALIIWAFHVDSLYSLQLKEVIIITCMVSGIVVFGLLITIEAENLPSQLLSSLKSIYYQRGQIMAHAKNLPAQLLSSLKSTCYHITKQRSQIMAHGVGIRIAPYAIGIACFILPFIQISCSGEKVVSFTGVQLVTGSEMAKPMSDEKEKIPPAPTAIIALVALVVGVILAIKLTRGASLLSATAGGVAVVSMVLLKTKMDAEIMKQAGGMAISADYQLGFWGVCIMSIAGAILALMRLQNIDAQPQPEQKQP